jgi:uncharacterized membrane protein YqgA involved in biofilm formation
MDVNSLRRTALEISPAAVATVDKKAGWNDAVKVTLIDSGATCSADLANRLELPAEYAPWVTLSIALTAILGSHLSISAELQSIAAQIKAEREKAAQQTLSHAAA